MSLRSTVYWGNDAPDGRSIESDEESEETEVESILGLDASNPQTDPMDIDIEEPTSSQPHEVREEHLQ